ncbi:MAG: hypothetical protein HWE20_08725 [Gammaproteobacteria bacterium]|nr:hypothetical protein [Gammaproteobacteria bacterium]
MKSHLLTVLLMLMVGCGGGVGSDASSEQPTDAENSTGDETEQSEQTDATGNGPSEATESPQATTPRSWSNCVDHLTVEGSHESTFEISDDLAAENNNWGRARANGEPYEQCVEVLVDAVGNVSAEWTWDWPIGVGGVKAYPELIIGSKFGQRGDTQMSSLPRSASANKPFSVQYSYQQQDRTPDGQSGRGNVALESWFHDMRDGREPTFDNVAYEMMVWLDYSGINPGGYYHSNATIGGYDWRLYHGDTGRWHYIAFVPDEPIPTSAVIDWAGMVAYLRDHADLPDVTTVQAAEKGHGAISFAQTEFTGVEFGTEIVAGQGYFKVGAFAVGEQAFDPPQVELPPEWVSQAPSFPYQWSQCGESYGRGPQSLWFDLNDRLQTRIDILNGFSVIEPYCLEVDQLGVDDFSVTADSALIDIPSVAQNASVKKSVVFGSQLGTRPLVDGLGLPVVVQEAAKLQLDYNISWLDTTPVDAPSQQALVLSSWLHNASQTAPSEDNITFKVSLWLDTVDRDNEIALVPDGVQQAVVVDGRDFWFYRDDGGEQQFDGGKGSVLAGTFVPIDGALPSSGTIDWQAFIEAASGLMSKVGIIGASGSVRAAESHFVSAEMALLTFQGQSEFSVEEFNVSLE